MQNLIFYLSTCFFLNGGKNVDNIKKRKNTECKIDVLRKGQGTFFVFKKSLGKMSNRNTSWLIDFISFVISHVETYFIRNEVRSKKYLLRISVLN